MYVCIACVIDLQDLNRPLNLLQERNIITIGSAEMPYPNLPQEFKKLNCNPESVIILLIFSGCCNTDCMFTVENLCS